MRKKLISVVLIVIVVTLFLSGCKKKDEVPNAPDSPIVVDENTDKVFEPNKDTVDKDSNDYVPEEPAKDNVKLEISKYMQLVNKETFSEVEYIRDNDGVVYAKIDNDGNLVIMMTDAKQKAISESLKGGLDSVIKGLTENEETSYVKDVKTNSDYSEIILTVDKDAYLIDKSNLVFFVAHTAGAYQTYSALPYNVTIIVKDVLTDEVILSEKYPEKIEKDIEAGLKSLEKNENSNVVKTPAELDAILKEEPKKDN